MYAIKSFDKQQGIRSDGDALLKKGLFPRRILLIDPEEEQQLILASLLREENHQVTTCSNSSAAVDLFEKKDFDFVIVGHVPNVLDRLHLLKQFKQLKTKIPI